MTTVTSETLTHLSTTLLANMTTITPNTTTVDTTSMASMTTEITKTMTAPDTTLTSNMTTIMLETVTSLDATLMVNVTSAMPDASAGSQDIGVLVVLVCICTLTFLLNVVLCSVILGYSKLHHMVFFYIASAAVSDCLRAATVMTLSTVRIVTGSWQVESAVCDGWYFLNIFFTTNTLCHMGFLSTHVYFTIKDPIRTKLSNRTLGNSIKIARTWFTAAAATGIPFLIFHTTQIGRQVNFLGCGRETVEYVLCSCGLGILLPIVVLIIIDTGSSIAIHKKRSLIHHLQSQGKTKTERKSVPVSSYRPIGERFVRLGSFSSSDSKKQRSTQNSANGRLVSSQLIQIKITDPDENTTTFLNPSLQGKDNPSFTPDETDASANDESCDSREQKSLNQQSSQSQIPVENHVELKVLNGQVHTGGDNQDEAHILIHTAPAHNNNVEPRPITNESSSDNTDASSTSKSAIYEQNQPTVSTSKSEDSDIRETSNYNKLNPGHDIVAMATTAGKGENDSAERYLDEVHREQYLLMSSRLAHIHAVALMMILLFFSFLLLNLPFYIAYVVYVLCTACQPQITQTLIWIFQWLSYGTSLVHPIISLVIITRVAKVP